MDLIDLGSAAEKSEEGEDEESDGEKKKKRESTKFCEREWVFIGSEFKAKANAVWIAIKSHTNFAFLEWK